jgi:hypothetical protein
MMNLFRDVLDKQLLDQNKVKCGKVDGLVMTVPSRGRPKISHVELGSLTLARRLGPRAESWVAHLERTLRRRQRHVPFRVEWSKITDIGVDIEVAIDGNITPYGRGREWLRKHVLKYLPGK